MTDHHNDLPQIPGPRQPSPAEADAPLATGQQPNVPPKDNTTPAWPRRTTAALHERWDDAWLPGGILYSRWDDVREAPELGWHGMAHWLKVAIALAAGAFLALFLDAAFGVITGWVHQLLTAAPRVQVGTDTSTGIWAVIDQPIRSYIAQHSAGLAVSGSTLYTLWQLVGLFGLFGGFLRSTAARLTWTAWGAASIAMVWTASPAPARNLATGLAAAAWLLGSAFALRGLTLRPAVYVHAPGPEIRNDIRPEIHVPAPADAPTDNVHPLQR
ncbi:hypothetical protein [Streptomyces longhuiensis]|uniref:hypothetical protein n=1 Tax=Streptomyces longhuiensis TaxID=2880933 RepID=UPI001D0B920E|nr:hypothetical protein [Streptomyces longhuiensis]UDM05569.1 hypothetical protein LGI35_45835 [Streptomyces longhuiensis]